jgi:hypothetical protein
MQALAFFFCARGDIDAVVWFLLHDFVAVDNENAPNARKTKHMVGSTSNIAVHNTLTVLAIL